jgi:hypothetical protein
MQDNKLKLLAYKYLGYCFHNLELHDFALKCFKKELDLAWDTKEIAMEFDAYDNIGLQYYYMGDIVRATFYHDKMMMGTTESPDSVFRKLRPNARFRYGSKSTNALSNNLKEILKRQYKRFYNEDEEPVEVQTQKANGFPIPKNYFSQSMQRFFSNQKKFSNAPAEITANQAKTGPNFYSTSYRATNTNLNSGLEQFLGVCPDDLSFNDLPSPNFHHIEMTVNKKSNKIPPSSRAVMAIVSKKFKVFVLVNAKIGYENYNTFPKPSKESAISERKIS